MDRVSSVVDGENSNIAENMNKPPISPKPLSTTLKPSQRNLESRKVNPIHQLNEKLEAQAVLIQKLVSDAEAKDKTIASLQKRLLKVEADQVKTDSLLFIKDNVSKLLSQRITNLEQYTRRYSVIVKGIPYERNEKYDVLKEQVMKVIEQANSETTFEDVDKFHRNGTRDGMYQDVIVRFKSHSAKENFYNKRKTIQLERIKIQPSLSSDRKKLLGAANDFVQSFKSAPGAYVNCPDFAFADVHGNLLVKMSNRTDNGLFFKFDSLDQLTKIIQLNNHSEADNVFEETMQLNEEDDEDLTVIVPATTAFIS